MRLILPAAIISRIRGELCRARRREIGGLLLGEHVGNEKFSVVDVTVQRTGGSHTGFIRNHSSHKKQLDAFFARTGSNYSRFNYLGEWHSHPSFPASPSSEDLATMQSIVSDPKVGANFLVLLIVKLGTRRELEVSATAFRKGAEPTAIHISGDDAEGHEQSVPRGWREWARRVFRC